MKILHNPRCSKSRATLQLLQDRGLDPEIIDYRKQPPSAAELAEIARQARRGTPPDDAQRRDHVYAELEASTIPGSVTTSC